MKPLSLLDNIEHGEILTMPNSAYLNSFWAGLKKRFPYSQRCPRCNELAEKLAMAKAWRTCKNKHVFQRQYVRRATVEAERYNYALRELKQIFAYKTVKAFLRKIAFTKNERRTLAALHLNRNLVSRYEKYENRLRLRYENREISEQVDKILG